MSVTSVSQPQTTTAATSSSENIIEIIIQPKNFIFLIPTVSAIALGIIFMPNFALGLAAGLGMLVVTVIAMKLLTVAGIIEDIKERSSEYSRQLAKESLAVALFGPIAEEAIFRGGFQPLVAQAVQLIVPAASVSLLSPSLSIATVISIVATGIIFGAVHYLNPHKGAFQQAVSASLGGIILGTLSAQFGIGAAVAAHIANNALIVTLLGFKTSPPSPDNEPYPRNKFRYSPLPA